MSINIKKNLKKIKAFRFFNMIRKNDLIYLRKYLKIRDQINNFDLLEKCEYKGFLMLKDLSINKYKNDKVRIEETILHKLKNKEIIKIAYIVPILSTWVGDDLFRKFEEDKRFDSYIIISSFNNGSHDTSNHEIPLIIQYCKERKFKYIVVSEKNHKWNETGNPDLLFYTSPYLTSLSPCLQPHNIPLSKLLLYTGYGFYLDDTLEMEFDMDIHNAAWRNYSHSFYYHTMAQKYSSIQGENLVYSGYCKVDKLIDANYLAPRAATLWKLKYPDTQLKIIYAPHHSIGNTEPFFGLFDYFYKDIYEFAKCNPKQTSWILKPHPVLRKTVIKQGLFKTIDEYDDYLNKWDSLPNAKVVTGEYMDYFLTSDCLLLDSVSFIAEYLYTQKPLLFIKRKEARFNEFGNKIADLITAVDLSDYKDKLLNLDNLDIVNNVNIKDFFDKYMNYYKTNNMLANEYIYFNICEIFE